MRKLRLFATSERERRLIHRIDFHFKECADTLYFIQQLQESGGKPVGMKIVIGQQKPLEDLIKQ